MRTQENRELTVALARAMVASTDRERLRYFDADAEAYFNDPLRALAHTREDTPLGSGLETFVAALTPVALYIAGKVADYVTEETIAEAGKRVRRRWTLRRSRPGRTTTSPCTALRDIRPLSAEQVEKIRQVVVNAAEVRGVATDTADDLAQAVLAHLPLQARPDGK